MGQTAELCTRNNYIRSNWYSDTYRAAVTAENGEKKMRDIVHISIPFDSVKETAYKTRYSLTDEQMQEFYRNFAYNIKLSWKLADYAADKKLNDYSCFSEQTSIIKKEHANGSDIFLVYPSNETLVGSRFLNHDGARLFDIYNIFKRLLFILGIYNEDGFRAGYLDMDSLLVENREGDNKIYITNPFFYAAAYHDLEPKPTRDIVQYAAGSGSGSYGNDISSLCKVIWAMLDGKHYTTSPDLSHSPKHAPEELAKLLRTMIESPDRSTGLVNSVYEIIKQEKKSRENVYIEFDDPVFGRIDYRPQEHIGDAVLRSRTAERSQEEDDDEFEEPDDDEDCGDDGYDYRPGLQLSKQKKLLLFSAGAVAFLSLIVFVTLPLLGIDLFGSREPVTTPTMTLSASSDSNIYLMDGRIIDKNGTELTEYCLDSAGNICRQDTGETVFYKEGVSPFYPVTCFELDVIEEHFTTYPQISDYGYRNRVSDLKGLVEFTYNDREHTLILPASAVITNTLREGRIVLLSINNETKALALSDGGTRMADGRYIFTTEAGIPAMTKVYNGDSQQIEEALRYDAQSEPAGEDYIGGEWTFTYRLKINPEPEHPATNGNVRITGNNGNLNLSCNGEAVTGPDVIGVTGSEVLITASSMAKGDYTVNIAAAVGGYSEDFIISVREGSRSPQAPNDYDVPEETDEPPIVETTPAPVPTQVPATPYIPAYSQEPAPTYQPAQPAATESSVFAVSTSNVSLSVGAAAAVTTTGDDGGYIRLTSSDESVAVISIDNSMNGFYTITGTGQGTCVITLESPNGLCNIQVTVS